MALGIVIVLSFVVGLALLLYFLLGFEKKSGDKDQEQMRRSLEEEYIFHPETNAKISLEQAESGEWDVNGNEFWERSEEDIRKFAFEDQKIMERALNYLRSSKWFLKAEPLNDESIETLYQTKILNQTENWIYSDIFYFDSGYVFAPHLKGECKLVMWLRIDAINGHYYFREKTKTEAFFDKIRNDDDISLINYECYTFKRSNQITRVKDLMSKLSGINHLEIEIMDNNLFIKTDRLINKEDVITFEKILSILYRDIKPFH
ncbi:hypothetical protein [uncultured Psychroserpens sp.]|uniref:hypothetical protein n=1 Tax=uncultured Psychroserpens sp. TaxID=255436 RepID=UPI0026284271|nr:hypothetical protein [uncultured Psychroserpens sp.]